MLGQATTTDFQSLNAAVTMPQSDPLAPAPYQCQCKTPRVYKSRLEQILHEGPPGWIAWVIAGLTIANQIRIWNKNR